MNLSKILFEDVFSLRTTFFIEHLQWMPLFDANGSNISSFTWTMRLQLRFQ